jgi:L-lactate dehydrogenase complex protein LldG
MSDSRNAILSRLRSAQRSARLPSVSADVHVPPQPARAADECLRRFVAELTALNVESCVEDSDGGVRDRIVAAVKGLSVFSWDAPHLPYDVARVLTNRIGGDAPREAQARADIGVTGCAAAIAETGTLVLLTGAGRPRAASLVPPIHLAVVRRADLVFGMTEFMRDRARDIADATCCTFVSGPSRTADIELTLTLGVHGPGRVIVVIGP